MSRAAHFDVFSVVAATLLCAAGLAGQLEQQVRFEVLQGFPGPEPAHSVYPLIQGADGDLYGTSAVGGDMGAGTIFLTSLGGRTRVLHAFNRFDGSSPAKLLEVAPGIFYGTTRGGGSHDLGTVFRMS